MTSGLLLGCFMQRGAERPRAACFLLVFIICMSSMGGKAWGQDNQSLTAALLEPSAIMPSKGISNRGVFQGQIAAAYRGYDGWDEAIGKDASPISWKTARISHSSGVVKTGGTRDEAWLRWVNSRSTPTFSVWMRAADASFYPAVYTSVPAWWAAAWLDSGVGTGDALAYTTGWLATAGSTIALKRLIKRERPFVSHPDLIIRYSDADLQALGANASTPSGHSSMAAFAAAFLALQVDSRLVWFGSGVWASSVAVSRLWNGVHYPSDVMLGSVLGTGLAILTAQFD
jgi:membrane-associated phospholipid phosphatase